MDCKNCRNLSKLYKHPWNKGDAKGTITEQVGWVCRLTFEDEIEPTSTFFDLENPLVGCEMFQEK